MTSSPATSFASSDRPASPNVWGRIALVLALSVVAAPITYFLWFWTFEAIWLLAAILWVSIAGRLVLAPAREQWGDIGGMIATAVIVTTTLFLAIGAALVLFGLLLGLSGGGDY